MERRHTVAVLLITAVLIAAAVSVPKYAGADGEKVYVVESGGVAEVVKEPRHHYLHLQRANQDSVGIQLTIFPGTAKVGERFDVFDQQGYLGRVEVTQVQEYNQGGYGGCNGSYQYTPQSKYIGNAPTRPMYGMAWAVGPAGKPLPKVRMIDNRAGLPESNQFPEVIVDLDGDGLGDMVRYNYGCKSRTPQQYTSYSAYGEDACTDIWVREGSWVRVQQGSWPACY